MDAPTKPDYLVIYILDVKHFCFEVYQNNKVIKYKLAKYLKKNCRFCIGSYFSFKCFQKRFFHQYYITQIAKSFLTASGKNKLLLSILFPQLLQDLFPSVHKKIINHAQLILCSLRLRVSTRLKTVQQIRCIIGVMNL